jgi:hypothetical protein
VHSLNLAHLALLVLLEFFSLPSLQHFIPVSQLLDDVIFLIHSFNQLLHLLVLLFALHYHLTEKETQLMITVMQWHVCIFHFFSARPAVPFYTDTLLVQVLGEHVNLFEQCLGSTVTLKKRRAYFLMGSCLCVFVGFFAFQTFELEFIKHGHHESGDFSGEVLFSAIWTLFTLGQPRSHAPSAF